MNVGDIVTLNQSGIRKLIVACRDEIVPRYGGWFDSHAPPQEFRMRTVYRLAGKEYSNQWFTQQDLSRWSKRHESR